MRNKIGTKKYVQKKTMCDRSTPERTTEAVRVDSAAIFAVRNMATLGVSVAFASFLTRPAPAEKGTEITVNVTGEQISPLVKTFSRLHQDIGSQIHQRRYFHKPHCSVGRSSWRQSSVLFLMRSVQFKTIYRFLPFRVHRRKM
jgi:hypothetical protein